MPGIPTDFPSITQAWFGIWYQPFGDEVDPVDLMFVRDRQLRSSFALPSSAERKPETVLLEIEVLSPPLDSTYLFIPGRRFDRMGTRHGRGHGWFDQFLAITPSSWIRIGVCSVEQASDETLVRQAWDQPMDGLLISGREEAVWFGARRG